MGLIDNYLKLQLGPCQLRMLVMTGRVEGVWLGKGIVMEVTEISIL